MATLHTRRTGGGMPQTGRVGIVACAVLFGVLLVAVAWGHALAGAQPTADTTGVTLGQGIRVSLADTGPAWLGEALVVAGIFATAWLLGVVMSHVLGRVSDCYPTWDDVYDEHDESAPRGVGRGAAAFDRHPHTRPPVPRPVEADGEPPGPGTVNAEDGAA